MTQWATGLKAVTNIYSNVNNGNNIKGTPDSFEASVETVDLETGIIGCKRKLNDVLDKNIIYARPSDVNSKKYPITGETVRIVKSADSSTQNLQNQNNTQYFYTSIVSAWGAVEHNAVPQEVITDTKESPTSKSYTDSEKGIPNKKEINTTKSVEPAFVETGKIRNLKHLAGDITYEGRRGSSIRLGNSTKTSDAPWQGEDGAPITIIRNGQKIVADNFLGAIYEDINEDGTSIYMCQNQTINFIPASVNFESYGETVVVHTPNKIVQVTQPEAVKDDISTPVEKQDTKEIVKSQIEEPKVVQIEKEPDPVQDELDEIPEGELLESEQLFEDVEVRHHDSEEYAIRLNSIPSRNKNYITPSTIGKDVFSDYVFLAYVTHQQGPYGGPAVIYYAKLNAPEVPRVNKFTSADVQGNMRNNGGTNFEKKFGKLTPLNFIYFLYNKYLDAGNEKIPANLYSIFDKYSKQYNVPLSFIKAVCVIESSFNPNCQDYYKDNKTGERKRSQYKGLFQLNLAEFKETYPNSIESDLFDAEKNANAGIKKLSKYLASAKIKYSNL